MPTAWTRDPSHTQTLHSSSYSHALVGFCKSSSVKQSFSETIRYNTDGSPEPYFTGLKLPVAVMNFLPHPLGSL